MQGSLLSAAGGKAAGTMSSLARTAEPSAAWHVGVTAVLEEDSKASTWTGMSRATAFRNSSLTAASLLRRSARLCAASLAALL